MELYGTGNEKRMTGIHETARFDEFTWAIGMLFDHDHLVLFLMIWHYSIVKLLNC